MNPKVPLRRHMPLIDYVSIASCFVEVEIDKDLKTITVTRAVTVVAAGKIINLKTATSQNARSMVWSISKALHEETIWMKNWVNTSIQT